MWITDDVMAKMPAPTYLVEDLIVDGSAVALVSAPGVGKTFVGLDMSFCIATGQPWHGFTTRQGPVIYILAEGLGGLRQRVLAWRTDRKIPDEIPAGVHFWDSAVQLAHFPDRMEFLHQLNAVPKPALIVVDTLARCFVGRDENAVQDMGLFVQGIDVLRQAAGCAILILHHQGHTPGRERGSTALRGAVDGLLFMEPGATSELVIRSQKQREGELLDPIVLKLRQVELPDGTTSCVVDDAPFDISGLKLPARWVEAVHTLAKLPNGATSSDWYHMTKLPKATYHRMRKMMVSQGLVALDGDRLIVKRLPVIEEKPNGETKSTDG